MMEKIREQVSEIQDSGEELELDGRQADRNDEVYDAVFEMCRIFAENPDLEWDMAFIGEIADCVASVLARHQGAFPLGGDQPGRLTVHC